MKRIALLTLALVLALGSMGIAYAAWTDEVTIEGSVDTGTVCTKWTEFYLRDASSGHSTYAIPPEYATVSVGIDPDDPTDKTAFIRIENLYPRDLITSLNWPADWPLVDVIGVSGIMVNCGSIPLRFAGTTLELIDDDDSVADHMYVIARLGFSPGGDHTQWYEIAHTGAPGVLLGDLPDWIDEKMDDWGGTLDPGDTLSFGDETIYLYLVHTAPQGASLQFTLKLNFEQWE